MSKTFASQPQSPRSERSAVAQDRAPKKTTHKPSDDFVAAFARGLAVIRAFGDKGDALTLSEAAARAGLSRAGARRLLHTLHALGYAEQREREFQLTPRILELGYAYVSSMPLWQSAKPVLEELAARVGEACSVTVLDRTDVVYVLRVESPRMLSMRVEVGSRLPAYACSMGRVLLAGLSPPQLQAYFREAELRAYTRHTVTDKARLLQLVAEAKRDGWAYADGELEEHVCGISAPVIGRDGKVIAAVSIASNPGRLQRRQFETRVLPQLRNAVARMQAIAAMRA
jgi:IclR family pca regulon transcriptional regulator